MGTTNQQIQLLTIFAVNRYSAFAILPNPMIDHDKRTITRTIKVSCIVTVFANRSCFFDNIAIKD